MSFPGIAYESEAVPGKPKSQHFIGFLNRKFWHSGGMNHPRCHQKHDRRMHSKYFWFRINNHWNELSSPSTSRQTPLISFPSFFFPGSCIRINYDDCHSLPYDPVHRAVNKCRNETRVMNYLFRIPITFPRKTQNEIKGIPIRASSQYSFSCAIVPRTPRPDDDVDVDEAHYSSSSARSTPKWNDETNNCAEWLTIRKRIIPSSLDMKWNAKGDFEMFLPCLMKLFADIEESFQERGLMHEWCQL